MALPHNGAPGVPLMVPSGGGINLSVPTPSNPTIFTPSYGGSIPATVAGITTPGLTRPTTHVGQPDGGSQSGFDALGGMASNPALQAGLAVGSQYFNDYASKHIPEGGIIGFLRGHLRRYFAVDNRYVLKKLSILLLGPIRKKSWQRSNAPPKDDENSPDLYIPLMAFVSYILLIAFVLGTSGKFTPEVLGMTASHGLIALIVEVAALKFFMYLLNATVGWLDLIAYSGYIFVGICYNHAAGLLFSFYLYFGVMVFTGVTTGYFMVQTLKQFIPGKDRRRSLFLVGVGVLQLAIMYVLGSFGVL